MAKNNPPKVWIDGCTCPECNKMFIPAPEHRYREDGKLYCSWGCLCKKRKRDGDVCKSVINLRAPYSWETKVDAVKRALAGEKIRDIARDIGCGSSTISVWKMTYWREITGGNYDKNGKPLL